MFAEILNIGLSPVKKVPFIKVKISSDSFATIWGETTQLKEGDFIEILMDNSGRATLDTSTADATKLQTAKAASTARRAAWGD